jgi:hypothetical protein
MKFYNELSSIETQIYKLETLRAIVSLMASGAQNGTNEEFECAIWFIEEYLDTATTNLRSSFNDMWQADVKSSKQDNKTEIGSE